MQMLVKEVKLKSSSYVQCKRWIDTEAETERKFKFTVDGQI